MLLEEFRCPKDSYGEVSFFWWHGDDITKEKLQWILEQIKGRHICGLQINYCHSDQGGLFYGLTMESNPRPFSDSWWELVGWFLDACKKEGIAVSLSDYTLGAPGQGFYVDEILSEHPEFSGQRLVKKDGFISVEKVPNSLNPMAPGVGQAVIEKFYGAFEQHFPGESGKGVNYFFSDELSFNIRGKLWSEHFREEFSARKGYDICEKWEALFEETGEDTVRVRLDYYDVIVQLSEEAYFKPVYDWHESHGMIFGCDHGGRGRDVVEFGDYFRTMKWYQGPGNDQPRLASDIIKSKVSSSIAHLYERPRVWLEGFYSSGWQTSAADVADAVFRNFGLGHNLLSLHGLYYSTHGSMWEWAPPCNHHHMPYWTVMGDFLACTKRLSYMLSQGVHRCDVAIVYPVAAMEADPEQGKEAVRTAFETAQRCYCKGIDFDFIDFQSIERAEIQNGCLQVSGEEYRCVILPEMKNVRYEMYRKLAEFSEAGEVIVIGTYPEGSDYAGEDPMALTKVTEKLKKQDVFFRNPEEAEQYIQKKDDLDFTYEKGNAYFQHRVIEGRDLFYLYGIEKGAGLRFRCTGFPVMLDPWTGKRYRFFDYEQQDGYTWMRMPVDRKELLLLAFEKEKSEVENLPAYPKELDRVLELTGECTCEFLPTMDNRYGDYRLPAEEAFLGPEARVLEYTYAKERVGAEEWKKEQTGYGVYFFVCKGNEEKEQEFIEMAVPTEGFEPYSFSLKEGVKGDAGYQGSYHGLKGKLSDDFLVMGEKQVGMAGSSSTYTGDGIWYFFTTVFSGEEGKQVWMEMGEKKPCRIWINHLEVQEKAVSLRKGTNTILLKFAGAGRTHFALCKGNAFCQRVPLATRWYQNTDMVPFDAYPERSGTDCWYRFVAPPGATAMKLVTIGETEVFVKNQKLQKKGMEYIFPESDGYAFPVLVRIRQERGIYGCAAVPEPVTFRTKTGKIRFPVDMEKNGLSFYSGGLKLTRIMEIDQVVRTGFTAGDERHAAKVSVNGKKVASLLAPPYCCEITSCLQVGENRIEVELYNTLYNHMKTIPTNFNFSESPADVPFPYGYL